MRSSSGPWGERLREGGKGDRSLTGSPMVPMRTIHEKEPQSTAITEPGRTTNRRPQTAR